MSLIQPSGGRGQAGLSEFRASLICGAGSWTARATQGNPASEETKQNPKKKTKRRGEEEEAEKENIIYYFTHQPVILEWEGKPPVSPALSNHHQYLEIFLASFLC